MSFIKAIHMADTNIALWVRNQTEDLTHGLNLFVYQAEKVGFRQQEIIHGSVNFENYTLFSACAHEYNWQKTRQKIKNPTLNFTKCWISEV